MERSFTTTVENALLFFPITSNAFAP